MSLHDERMARVADYGSLIEAIERRRVELGLTQIELDDRAGLAAGHYSHIAAWRSPQGRNLGATTLARVLSALGLALDVVRVKAVELGARDGRMARPGARKPRGQETCGSRSIPAADR